jgi:hypothetical protein
MSAPVGVNLRRERDFLDRSRATRAGVFEVGTVTTPEQGPVLITVEYRVAPANVDDVLHAVAAYERIRRRDGAFRWTMFRDVEPFYLETFLVSSRAEHLRQHERFTLGDHELEGRIAALVQGEPTIRHLVQPNLA